MPGNWEQQKLQHRKNMPKHNTRYIPYNRMGDRIDRGLSKWDTKQKQKKYIHTHTYIHAAVSFAGIACVKTIDTQGTGSAVARRGEKSLVRDPVS